MNIARRLATVRPSRRLAAALGVALATGGGVLATGVGTASASSLPYWSTLVPSSSWLDVAVSGGSTAPGAPIIQWWADGGAEQQWHIPGNGTVGPIVNQNSGMCITTDGVAGDGLFQDYCNGSPGQQWFASNLFDGPQTYTNEASGLVMDVSGYSLWGGGAIDAWYSNAAPNQYFWSSIGYLSN